MSEIDNFQKLESKIRELIEQSRHKVAVTVNAELTTLYWQIGSLINSGVLQNERAEYGKKFVFSLSKQLSKEYGRAFSEKNVRRMVQFAQVFSDEKIVASLRRQLTWTHFKLLIPIENEVKRNFYIEMCKLERWSTRTLQERIDSMLFERTAISGKPEKTIESELRELRDNKKMSPDLIFRDPYFLDFLGLEDTYSESDLETAILANLQRFILEFGSDFAFLSRQKRITIGEDDFYIDILFYHRRLKRLIAIELKLGKFKHEYKSQLELYLRWLNKHERQQGEESPIGILLCSDKNDEMVELLELDKSGIHVATYFTELPPLDWLKEKLQRSIEEAKITNRKSI